MINTAKVREAIIDLLKADTAVGELVGDDIREESFMGQTYTYPEGRVHIIGLSPIGSAGTCDEHALQFTLTYYHAGKSSAPCSTGTVVLCEAVLEEYLSGEGFSAMSLVVLDNVGDPIPESIGCWMCRAFLSCRLREV